jgi:cytoskeleton protein RodZ
MATKKKEVVTQEEVQEIQSVLGGALKKERETQKLSLKDICNRLHLNEKQITAMEQDDFASFGDPTRARAFLRSYARLLSLDEEVIVGRHRQLFPTEALNPINVSTETLANTPKGEGIPKYYLVVGALVLSALLVWFLPTLNFGRSSPEEVQAETTQEALPEVALPASERSQEDAAKALVNEIQLPQQPQAAATAPVESAKPEPAKVEPTKPVEVKAAEVKPAEPAKVPANATSVKFVVTENAWVDVKDGAGKTVFTKVLKPGVDETAQGVPPLKIHVGNAKGTKLFYNGQPFDYSATITGNTARVTIGQ